jgi:hypothetical protein
LLVFGLSTRPTFADTFTLDQSFTAGNNLGANINSCCAFVGQTYTAGLTGTLAGVLIDIHELNGYDLPLDVQIRTVVGGLPTSTILGKKVTTVFGLSDSDIITFSKHIAQVAGTQYAIVVDFLGAPPPGPDDAVGIWGGATGNLYSGGVSVLSFDGGVTWAASGPDFDTHFKTFVATPEPSVVFLMTSSLLSLAALRLRFPSRRRINAAERLA